MSGVGALRHPRQVEDSRFTPMASAGEPEQPRSKAARKKK
jgi:hypothetical protein